MLWKGFLSAPPPVPWGQGLFFVILTPPLAPLYALTKATIHWGTRPDSGTDRLFPYHWFLLSFPSPWDSVLIQHQWDLCPTCGTRSSSRVRLCHGLPVIPRMESQTVSVVFKIEWTFWLPWLFLSPCHVNLQFLALVPVLGCCISSSLHTEASSRVCLLLFRLWSQLTCPIFPEYNEQAALPNYFLAKLCFTFLTLTP